MTNSTVDYCQKCYLYYLFYILEHQIEVIFDIEKQNGLISTCHLGILNTIQSKASLGTTVHIVLLLFN